MLSLSALLGRDGLWARPSIFFLGALALSLSASTVAPASAQDESSDPARAMAAVAKDGVKRAFLVGVDDYAEFDALKYASSDVEAIRAKLFELGFEPANVVELTSKSEARLLPTQRNIERQLETFLATAGPNDVLFLYFAGRGFQTGGVARFAPLDAEATDDEGGVDAETTISIVNVMKRLSLLKSKSKWLILDVSRENSTGTQSGAANAGALKKLVSPSGVLVLQSCSEGERLYGNVETERGLFTEQLLEAFDGDADANDDGRISAREVCAYVSKQTSAESQARFNAPQTPRFSDDFADFIVAENLRQSGLTRDAWARAEALYAESHELAMAEKFDEAKARIADAIKIVANATDETAKKRYLDRQKEIELLASTAGDEATRSDVCVVSNAAELFDAVTNAADGAVVKLKDGTYKMTAELAPRRSLTFVGESGDREKVQLVFPGAAVTANSGVELAFENLTLTAERAVAINMLQDSAVKATQCNIVASQNPAVYGLGRCFLKDSNVRGRERITMNDLMRMNQNLTLYPIGVLVLGGGSLTAENCDIAPGVLIGPKAQASSLKKCALHRNAKAPINVNEVRSAASDMSYDITSLFGVADATCEIHDCQFYNPGRPMTIQTAIAIQGGRALISGGEIRVGHSSASGSVPHPLGAVQITDGGELTLRDVKIVDYAAGVAATDNATCDATNVTFENVASKWGYDPSSRITSDGQAAPNSYGSYGQPMNNGYGY